MLFLLIFFWLLSIKSNYEYYQMIKYQIRTLVLTQERYDNYIYWLHGYFLIIIAQIYLLYKFMVYAKDKVNERLNNNYEIN